MSPAPTMQAQVETYLATRRSMGFDFRIAGRQLLAFARFADQTGYCGSHGRHRRAMGAELAAGHPTDLGPSDPTAPALHAVLRSV